MNGVALRTYISVQAEPANASTKAAQSCPDVSLLTSLFTVSSGTYRCMKSLLSSTMSFCIQRPGLDHAGYGNPGQVVPMEASTCHF